MRRTFVYIIYCYLTIQTCVAVPAYRGWCQKMQPDGNMLTVRLVGDEYYHYWETEDGMQAVESPDGTFVKTQTTIPSSDVVRARRSAAMKSTTGVTQPYHAPQEFGVSPTLFTRGLVILVNFSNSKMDTAHTQAVFDDMCNAVNCTTNTYKGKNYGSVAQYFADQSNGAYRPVFDVFGPVTLLHPVNYYGEDYETDSTHSNNRYMADFVIDAVNAADALGCDFSQYDYDNDGYVDFVYFIFAGKGQAAGGASETIWPHKYNLISALYYNLTHGSSGYYYVNNTNYRLPRLDGKLINLYACSAELNGSGQLGGIGTMCHEFSHMLGLVDLYDTEYGVNREESLTPGIWDVMDQGNYNGDGHCPPNYNPWEKYFFGWVTPTNPGEEGGYFSLYPNGDTNYNTFQINDSTNVKGASESGLCYYLENRQNVGWDEFVPTKGLLVWKVNYDKDIWKQNLPNASSTSNSPRLSMVLVEDEWLDVNNKPVTEIYDLDSVLIFKYMDGGTDTPPDAPAPIWTDWAYYDNGEYLTSLGYGGAPFYWGIMFPANTLAHDTLLKVAIFETRTYNIHPITIDVYSGGYLPMEENKIYTETVNPAGQTGFHEITFAAPVVFNKRKNLWIVLSADQDQYPATYCRNTGDANGRWIALKESLNWWDLATAEDRDYTVMLRAYVGAQQPNPSLGCEKVNTETQGTKLFRDGQILILRGDKTYTLTGQEVK